MEAKETIVVNNNANNSYKIYDVNSKNKGYTMCVPRNSGKKDYKVFASFPKKMTYDSMLSKNSKDLKDNGVLLILGIEDKYLQTAAIENDNMLFKDIYLNLVNNVNNCRAFLTESGSKVSSDVGLMIDSSNEFEFKFYSWLEIYGLDKWFNKVETSNKDNKAINNTQDGLSFKPMVLESTYHREEVQPQVLSKPKVRTLKKDGFSNVILFMIVIGIIALGFIIPLLLIK